MPNIHYVKQGQGPLVVLSHALGCDLSMWDGVADVLRNQYTVLRYDHRGHGQSGSQPGEWSIHDLAADAAKLIAKSTSEPVHFVGLSMGGMTALALAQSHPQLVRSLVVANAASQYDVGARSMWRQRVELVRSQGMAAIADGALQRWFTPEFRASADGGARVSGMRRILEAIAREPYAQACEAVAAIDLGGGNKGIRCPVLVIAGARDEATPVSMSESIAAQINGAMLCRLDAAHLSAVEKPAAFAQLLLDFWSASVGSRLVVG